jgi:hypothetical protein
MAFKTLLTVTGLGLGNGDLKIAADLCAEVEAHLSVLVVALAAPPPIGEYGMVSDVWIEQRQQDMSELEARTAAASKFIADIGLSADLANEYIDAASADDVIGRRGRYADLTVVGPEMLSRQRLQEKVVEGALFSSGGPLLLAPKGSSRR